MAEPNKVDIEFNAKTERASSDVKKMQRDIEATGASGKKAAASITGSAFGLFKRTSYVVILYAPTVSTRLTNMPGMIRV